MRKKAHCAPSEELYHWGNRQYYVNINDFSLARSQLEMLSVYSIQSFQEYYKMINISTWGVKHPSPFLIVKCDMPMGTSLLKGG